MDEPVLNLVCLVVVSNSVEKSAGGCVEVGEVEGDGFRVHSGRAEIVFSEELNHGVLCSVEELEAHGVVGLFFCELEGVQKPEDVAGCKFFAGCCHSREQRHCHGGSAVAAGHLEARARARTACCAGP